MTSAQAGPTGTPTATSPSTPASGRQHRIRSGPYEATIASIGASLRELRHDGRDLVVPYEADEVRPGYRGATLVPWPNRVVDGEFSFDGAHHVLPLTEPARGHALHGLGCWLDYSVMDFGPAFVTLGARIVAQAGYPWQLDIETTYALSDEGLRQTVTVTNIGDASAPFGTGPHPYLVAGAGHVDDWTLELPADEVLTVTPDRLVPIERRPVAGEEGESFDFRRPRAIGGTAIDHAFTSLITGADGRVTTRVTDASGSGVAMTWDAACRWVQVHTADVPGSPAHRIGLAVEPMTCPPDAFNSGIDLIVVEPGESTSASWVISAL